MSKTIIVYQDSDPSTLRAHATQHELDAFCQNLARHLSELFSRDIEVQQCVGGKRVGAICPGNEDIDEYVRNLRTGDSWLGFLRTDD